MTVLSRGRRQRKGIRVHSTLDLPPDHVTTHDRIPVTTPTRTLADLAGSVSRPQLARALEAAEYHRLLDVPSLLAVSAGRPGAQHIRDLTKHATQRTRSDFEAAFVDLCDRYGLPRPVTNTHVHGYRDRRLLAGARPRRRARQLAPPRHASGVRARQGARRGAARARDHDAPLHLPPGHQATAMGRRQAQPVTRATFSRWIFFIAPFRRAKGKAASEPRATSADR